MPRKAKKQSKKRVYKKRKSTTSTTNKNKNIIRISLSGSGSGGGGGSSIIPLPYPSSIGPQMFPSIQPPNIFNIMSKSPFEREYNPEEQAPPVIPIRSPAPAPAPAHSSPFLPEKPQGFAPVGGGRKPPFQPVGGGGISADLIEELKKKQDQIKLKKLKEMMDAEKEKENKSNLVRQVST